MVALRPLGNELILLIKASAVASIVTVLDLMGETRLRLFAQLRPDGLSLRRSHLSGARRGNPAHVELPGPAPDAAPPP